MMIHLIYTNKKASSDIIVTDEYGNITKEREMLRCVHCGFHWEVQPGSGRKRGFCQKCCGPTCGSTQCDTCNPVMKQLGY